MAVPRLSIIVLTDDFSTIRRLVQHLEAQTIAGDVELVVVCPSEKALELPVGAASALARVAVVEAPPLPLGPARTAAEAVVRGLPVIASATGGLAETVEPGVTGLLFPNGDADALAACLIEIASRSTLAEGVPPDRAEQVMAQHELGPHVVRLRSVFARVCA